MLKHYKAIFIGILAVLILFSLYRYPYDITIPFEYSCDLKEGNLDNYLKIQAVRMIAYDDSEDFCAIEAVNKVRESKKSKTFDYHLYKKLANAREILSNPSMMEKRNAYLRMLIDGEDALLSIPFSRQSINLSSNLNKIKKYLSYNKVYTEMIKLKDGAYRLIITSDSNSPISLVNLNAVIESKGEIEIYNDDNFFSKVDKEGLNAFFSNKRIYIGIDKHLEITKMPYSYIIKGAGLKIYSINPEYININTKLSLPSRDNNFVLIDKPDNFSFDYIDQDIQEFIEKSSDIKFKMIGESTLKILKGEYFIQKSVVIPYGVSLIIESGVTFKMNKGVSIVVYGSLDIQGKNKDPVIIESKEANREFGVFSVVGNGETNVSIKNLIMLGGSEASINGSFFSGALSLYNHNTVKINDSKVYKNIGGDGVNIKDSKVILKDNFFYLNYSDQVDLDNCIADVRHNIFSANDINLNSKLKQPLNSNGDGIDFSGSKAFLYQNIFSNFSDKGVSVGEKTKLNSLKNYFYKNNIGIAIKDQSQATLSHNIFKENKDNISMYVKKNIFNSPVLFIPKCKDLNKITPQRKFKVFCGELYNENELIAEIKKTDPLFFNHLNK
jgi:hypothetical protein